MWMEGHQHSWSRSVWWSWVFVDWILAKYSVLGIMEIELVQGRENGSEEINEQSVGVAAQPKTRFIHLV